MKIAYCFSEVFPFAKSGGLGDVGGSLPLALEEAGHDVAIFMPGYRCVGQSGIKIEQLNDQVSRATIGRQINVYFVDHQKYFDRQGFYGDESGGYPDNIERFSYFCDQALKLCKELDFKPDIVHCHDWHSALIPVYLKEKYSGDAFYADTKCLLTIHNLAFQGVFPKEQYSKIGLDDALFKRCGFDFHDQVNLLKAGIINCDRVTTVSPQYAKEILTKRLGCGLENVLSERNGDLVGILNGLDGNVWDPSQDSHIVEQYTESNCEQAKIKNKVQLQKKLGLLVNKDVPLFGFVGRLSHQKGIDLILDIADELINMGAQMIVLGSGDAQLEKKLNCLASENSRHVAVHRGFNEPLGHQIYAASDFFLMPSLFEPCGLSQMISFCYGTVPIVFKTGGLIDTVKPYGLFHRNGNGLVFKKHTKEAFISIIKRAMSIFMRKDQFGRLRHNAISTKFTWDNSAKKYQELYQCV